MHLTRPTLGALATIFHGLFPGLAADLVGLVDSLLPGRPTPGNALRHGAEQRTVMMRSPLLVFGQAAIRLNQRYAVTQRDGPAVADELASARE